MSNELLSILDNWAKDEYIQFVSRSEGQRTATTVSKDSLRLLIERVKNHVLVTPQPKPAPVLLTDDELEELWRDEWDGFVSFEEARIVARAIESAVLRKQGWGV